MSSSCDRLRGLPILTLVALAMFVLTGCGSSGSTTLVDTSTSSTEPAVEPAPHGTLAADRIGPVSQGMTTEEVQALFGPPDDTDHFPGCEIDPGAKPTLVLRWHLRGGDLNLSFDAVTGRLVSYNTDSDQLATTLGDEVGDPFTSLSRNWGDSLKPLSLGVQSTGREGYWHVGDPSVAELLFDVRSGAIASISGGYLPPCE